MDIFSVADLRPRSSKIFGCVFGYQQVIATNGSGFWQARGSADRLPAQKAILAALMREQDADGWAN